MIEYRSKSAYRTPIHGGDHYDFYCGHGGREHGAGVDDGGGGGGDDVVSQY